MKYEGRYIIWGPPGCGKTTFLSKQVRAIARDNPVEASYIKREPVAVCSLARAAAAEVAGRDLPISKQQVGTLHSFAYRQLDYPKVAESMAEQWNEDRGTLHFSRDTRPDVDDLTTRSSGATAGDELYERYQLLRARMVDRALWPRSVLAFAQTWEDWKVEHEFVDFTDMIEQALESVPTAPNEPKVVIADEAQDLSALEFALLQKWGDAAGALMMAGDPWQALFTWRGAHPEMFTDKTVDGDHRRVLSQSYRVPRAVHARAMKWAELLSDFEAIDYKPRDHAGLVSTVEATWKVPEGAVKLADEYLKQGKSVMFLMTCGYMLTPLLSVLRHQGIPFSNPWRRKRGDWNPLRASRGVSFKDRVLNLLKPVDEVWGEHAGIWSWKEFETWCSVLRAKGVLNHGAKKRLAELARENKGQSFDLHTLPEFFGMEMVKKIFGLIDQAGVGEILDWWEDHLMTDKRARAQFPLTIARRRGAGVLRDEPKLYVGTIHSFKGGEADVVFLFPDLSPAAMREWERGRGKERDNVVRAFYVGMTRAKETLHLCHASTHWCVWS